MDPSTAAVALAQLFIEWTKERRDTSHSIDDAAFRAWLREVAFPQLLASSKDTLDVLSLSQKAHHAELLGFLNSQFGEIRRKLEEAHPGGGNAATLIDRWQRLGEPTASLLRALTSQVDIRASTYEDARIPVEVAARSPKGGDATDYRRAEHASLIRSTEVTGGCMWIRLTALGYLVTTAASSVSEFEATLQRLRVAVTSAPQGPVDKIVAYTMGRCTASVAYAVMEQWDAIGWIGLQKLDQREDSRLFRPAPALFEADPSELLRMTLRPFLD